MALTSKDIETLMKGIAPAIADLVSPLTHRLNEQVDINRDLQADNRRLQQRIDLLERQRGYETIGTGTDGKPRIRRL